MAITGLRTRTRAAKQRLERCAADLTWSVDVCILTCVTRERVNFWIDPDLAEGLKTVKVRDGVSESEQIRRGIKMYLESKGLQFTPARKGGTRKR